MFLWLLFKPFQLGFIFRCLPGSPYHHNKRIRRYIQSPGPYVEGYDSRLVPLSAFQVHGWWLVFLTCSWVDSDGFNFSTSVGDLTYQVGAYFYSHLPQKIHGLQGRPPEGFLTSFVFLGLMVLAFVVPFFTSLLRLYGLHLGFLKFSPSSKTLACEEDLPSGHEEQHVKVNEDELGVQTPQKQMVEQQNEKKQDVESPQQEMVELHNKLLNNKLQPSRKPSQSFMSMPTLPQST